MRNQEGLQSLQRSLNDLPEWASEQVMQQIRQLTNYEPMIGIGIMGKTGAGKSSLCNALFQGEASSVSDIYCCLYPRTIMFSPTDRRAEYDSCEPARRRRERCSRC